MRLVADRLGHLPLVVDPVLVATSGAVLGDSEVARAYVDRLLPHALVATPNRDEARALTGHDGPPVRPGHAAGRPRLRRRGHRRRREGQRLARPPGWPARQLAHPRVDTTNDHGTGCTFASAVAALLARGCELDAAVADAAAYVVGQLTTSSTWDLGRGRGPIAHTSPNQQEEIA